MSNVPTTALLSPTPAATPASSPCSSTALDGVAVSDCERASLTWLAGFEASTVENLAAVITRARDLDPKIGTAVPSCTAT